MTDIIKRTPGRLRSVIEAAKRESGLSLADLTALATQHDPYRHDTASGHRDGEWFKVQLDHALQAGGRTRERLHLRGIHYAIISRGDVLKPNGEPYRNTGEDWYWLQTFPSKSARWLGIVPFSAIADQRNNPPAFHYRPARIPHPYLEFNVDIRLPDPNDLEPVVGALWFEGRQPFHIALFGEKSSLEDTLLPIARRYQASLYLPQGEISDTQLHEMARHAAEDGRPLVVFTFSDADPAGHQMPISISRKLQALRDLLFPDLKFEVRPVGLTVEQAKQLDLPSTPLKSGELRGDRWMEAHGIAQVEIDALATLKPDVLEMIARDAIDPFFDHSLDRRVRETYGDWLEQAEAALMEQVDGDHLDQIRETAAEKLAELEAEVQAIREALRQSVPEEITFPEIEIPDPVIDRESYPKPLISSDWPWTEQTLALKRQKAYAGDLAGGGSA